jgi:putative ABC transport system permease protein
LPFGKGVFYQNEVDNIAALDHIKDISKTLVLWRFDKGKFISIEGLEPNSFIGREYSSAVTTGRFFGASEENKAVVEKHFAKFYGLKLGDNLQLGNSTFEIIGILATPSESQISATNIYTNLTDAQRLLDTQGYSQLYVRLDAVSSENIIRSEIDKIDKDAIVISGSSIATSLSNVIKIYEKFRVLVLAIIGVILTLILFQVNAASLVERRKDIGVLQTIGWTRANISWQIVSEIFLQTILGFVMGIFVSVLILAAIGSIGIQANLSQGMSNNLSTLTAPLTLSGTAVYQFLVLTLAVAVVISLFLARKLAGMKPLINLKNL